MGAKARARKVRTKERAKARARTRARARRSSFAMFVSNVSPNLAMFFTCPVLMGNARWEFGMLSGAIKGVREAFLRRVLKPVGDFGDGAWPSLLAGVLSAAVARTIF